MSNHPENSSGRWWEIHGEGQPDDDGYRELMTDTQGRSRPERSLSAGADLADESRHPSRAFLWPVVSVIAAAGLVLSVVYVVSSGKHTAPPRELAISGSAQGGVAVRQEDPGARPVVPPAQGGNAAPVAGGAPPAIGGQVVAPRVSGGPVGAPSGPAGPVIASPGGAAGDAGTQPAWTRSSGAPAAPQEPPAKLDTLDGRAPAAPKTRQTGPAEPGTGTTDSCARNTGKDYACTITRTAPVYLPETNEPYSDLKPGTQITFLCQIAGSGYSVGNRASSWWAWLVVPFIKVGLWVPVVFLKGAPDNGPEPGLPVCDSRPQSTTSPSAPPTSSTPTSPPAAPPPASGGPTTSTKPSR